MFYRSWRKLYRGREQNTFLLRHHPAATPSLPTLTVPSPQIEHNAVQHKAVRYSIYSKKTLIVPSHTITATHPFHLQIPLSSTQITPTHTLLQLPRSFPTTRKQLLHPPTVVRSAWVADSARAGRSLPVADYMVDGVFVQKRTLAACFAGASSSGNPTHLTPSRSDRNPDESKDEQVVGADGDKVDSRGVVHRARPLLGALEKGYSEANPSRVYDRRGGCKRSFEGVCKGGASVNGSASKMGSGSTARHESTVDVISEACALSQGKHGTPGPLKLPPAGKQILTPSDQVQGITPPSPQQDMFATAISSSSVDSGQGTFEGFPRNAQAVRLIEDRRGERSSSKPKTPVAALPPFELPEMGSAGEEARSTKNDPTFMETFFQKSRLHYIGVG